MKILWIICDHANKSDFYRRDYVVSPVDNRLKSCETFICDLWSVHQFCQIMLKNNRRKSSIYLFVRLIYRDIKTFHTIY
jgi:hypothetical protein